MATAAIGDIWLVTFSLTQGGQRLQNRFLYRLETVPGGTTTDTISNEMNTLMTAGGNLFPKYLAALNPAVTVAERWFQRIWPTRIRKTVFVSGLAGAWVNTGTATNSAVSIERHTENATRHGVGRIQLPASNSPLDITAGVITNVAYTTVLQTLATQMLQPLNLVPSGATMKPVLVAQNNPASFLYLNGAFPQSTLRSMRRRTVGVGK